MITLHPQLGSETLTLPNPTFNSLENLVAKTDVRRALDGTTYYSYSRHSRTQDLILRFEFVVSELKYAQIMEYFNAAADDTKRNVDIIHNIWWEDGEYIRVYRGYLIEPLNYTSLSRAAPCVYEEGSRAEQGRVTLVFQVVKDFSSE